MQHVRVGDDRAYAGGCNVTLTVFLEDRVGNRGRAW